MNKRLITILALGGLIILLPALAACGTDVKPLETKLATVEAMAGKLAVPAKAVEFTLTGVELKGSTVIKDLAAPEKNPTELSDGYRYKPPGKADAANPDKWEVASYVWAPAAMTVFQGDKVTLRTFAVNGDEHKTWVEAPDGKPAVPEQVINRGREYVLKFTADQVGNYRVLCTTHEPTMTAIITVLPRA